MGAWIKSLACVLAAGCVTVQANIIQFDDPLAPSQWYLEPIRFGEAWATVLEQSRRGQVTVAVLDSGFQADHPDLAANLMPGINIVDGSANIEPVHPHGTATGGIPGARSGNGQGISQTALTAEVLPIRISDRADGAAYVSDIARAIRVAADQGARVINVSYGGVGSRQIARAANYARRNGALTFMAAGNSGFQVGWRNYQSLIAVGSVGRDGERSYFSTYGRFVDFVAPGERVTTLYTDSGFADWSGTSFASPIAASVASLVLAANPELSPAQVLRIMRNTAVDLGARGRDREYGYGLPDAEAAVDLALRTAGAYRRRLQRQGLDPFIANTDYPVDGLLAVEALPPPGDAGWALAEPQGFLTPRQHEVPPPVLAARPVPAPGTGAMLLWAVALAGGSRRRGPRPLPGAGAQVRP